MGGSAPRTTTELKAWVQRHLALDAAVEAALIEAVEQIVAQQRQLLEQSKHDAIQALSEGFAQKLSDVQRELQEKESTLNTIARYFEAVVADLSDRSHRDPKTKLLNFDWFMERLESFLGAEQRARWCAIGVVDLHRFKQYNDTLGHAVGDRIIERVATILSEQIRSEDLLALERPTSRDLHARFGGDEFCFMIPDLPGHGEAEHIAARFKNAVEGFDWGREDKRLSHWPVLVDVGVVILRLGPVEERRGVARKLAADLIHRADQLMYSAKGERASHIYMVCTRVADGELVEVADDETPRVASGEVTEFPALEE
ncbi:MAG TPA: GGDEF domain-containing protein [Vicinamibacterales bacterium]|nr:GGDEF domain-containing protein [Vicinamibacterales bacterium]